MSLIENYLCNGEKVLYHLSRKNYRGVPEELVATNMRIIHAKGDKFHDIKYGYLASIGDYVYFEWKWAIPAAYYILFAILAIVAALAIPTMSSDLSGSLQSSLNSSYAQMSVGYVYNTTTQAYQAIPLNASGIAPEQGMDLRGTMDSLSDILSKAAYAFAAYYLAMAALRMIEFLLKVKTGIIMKTPDETYSFKYGTGQKAEALEFIRTVRQAEEEKIKVLQQCMPELFINITSKRE